MLRSLGKIPEADAAYRRALDIQEKLVAESPAVPKFRRDLARSYNSLGILLADLGKRAEAAESYQRAFRIQQELPAEFLTVPQYRVEVAGSQVNFGNLQLANGQPEEALQLHTRAIQTLEGVLQQVKVDGGAQRFLRNAHWGRAQALKELMRFADAAAELDKAVQLSPELERPQFRMNRAACRVRAGQVDAALKEAEELAKIVHPVILYDAACVFALAADRRDESGGSLSKEVCAKRAVALLHQAVVEGFKDAEHMKKDDD